MSSCMIGTIEFTGQLGGECDWDALSNPLPPRLSRESAATAIESIPVDADALRHDLASLFNSYRRQLSRWSRG